MLEVCVYSNYQHGAGTCFTAMEFSQTKIEQGCKVALRKFPTSYIFCNVVGCHDHKLPVDMEALDFLERNYSYYDSLPFEYWCYKEAVVM